MILKVREKIYMKLMEHFPLTPEQISHLTYAQQLVMLRAIPTNTEVVFDSMDAFRHWKEKRNV